MNRREELAHHDARADELVERRARPELHFARLVGAVVHEQVGHSEANSPVLGNEGSRDTHAVDERSVATAQISNPKPIVSDFELGVETRDRVVLDDESRPFRGAHEDASLEDAEVVP